MPRLAAAATLLLLLTAAAPASAAPAVQASLAKAEVRYGASHRINGTLRDGAAPLAGQPVVLEGRRYPFDGDFRALESAVTDAQGAFAFRTALDRNYELRVAAPMQNARSPVLRAYTFPAFQLSFRALRAGVVRLYQRYTVPRAVRLTAPTLFYLGPQGAKRSSKVVSRRPKRVKAGRFSSIATVHIPRGWHGRFSYASCFKTTPHSGMGDPKATCPKRFRF